MEVGKTTKGIGLLTLLPKELLTITAIFKKIDANGDSLIKAAGAVALLTIPVFLLGRMDIGTALKGIVGVGIILTELALFMRIAGKGMTGKQSFLGLVVAVNLLVLAVKSLGDMNLGSAMKGIAGLGLVMLELSLFMGKAKTGKITGMISMALAMNLLVRAVRKMGSLNTKPLRRESLAWVVYSQPHGISMRLVCTRIEYDLENPANNTYTFGNPKQTLTQRYQQDTQLLFCAVRTFGGRFTGLMLVVFQMMKHRAFAIKFFGDCLNAFLDNSSRRYMYLSYSHMGRETFMVALYLDDACGNSFFSNHPQAPYLA